MLRAIFRCPAARPTVFIRSISAAPESNQRPVYTPDDVYSQTVSSPARKRKIVQILVSGLAIGTLAAYVREQYSKKGGQTAHAEELKKIVTGAGKDEATEEIALDPKNWRPFTLQSVKKVNHNTNIYTLDLGDPNKKLGLTVASCLMVRAVIDGEEVARPYTPISTKDQRGTVELMIKTYENGKISKWINERKPGDQIELKGPFPKYKYQANEKSSITMIAGGTGITPMLQVIKEIVNNPNDKTQIYLIFANIEEKDILLKSELDSLASKDKRLHILYTVDKGNPNWKGHVGYVTKDMISKFSPKPSKDTIVFVCGPPPMVKIIAGEKGPNFTQGEVSGILKELGYDSTNVYKF